MSRTRAKRARQTVKVSPVRRFAAFYLRLPRLARIVLAGLFAVGVTLVMSPLVDDVYLRYFFDPRSVIVPSLVSTGLGLVMYVVGWRLTVGVYEDEMKSGTGALAYVSAGCAVLLVLVVLVIWGLITGNTPTI